jgi:saccharopine dehydrogenase-like NADP-dependent oxidoreductase
VEVDGQRVSPRAVTQKLLFQAWELPAGAGDLTVLRVTVVGAVAGAARTVRWDLLDRNDRQAGATSMARTTGFPCALVVRLVADGTWSRPGITAPEALGADAAIAKTILDGLADRGVRLTRRETVAA